jgi:hypothetical protein
VQTDSPTVGGTLEARELTDLPSVTQSTDYIMSLVPGMSVAIPFGNSNPDIGGAPYTGSSNWTVNGISTNNPGQGGGGNVTYVGSCEFIAQANLPSIGTLQEFKVDSSVVGAEYRSQTAITMVTKQETNQYHGEVYEYNENKALSCQLFRFKQTQREPISLQPQSVRGATERADSARQDVLLCQLRWDSRGPQPAGNDEFPYFGHAQRGFQDPLPFLEQPGSVHGPERPAIV